MLHVFTRACVMLAQAGYTERAVAACQAMVEFNCFAPAAFARQTFKQRVSLFEDFWETECARFGEDGACGWSNSLFDDGNDAAGAEMEGMTADDIDGEGAPNLHRLYQREILGQRESWRPLRGSTDEDQQDPFRTVLFDDIRGLMFEAQCLQTKRGLVFLLLRLLGTSFNACVGSSHAGMVDPFICGGEAMGAAAERAGRILAIRTSAESAMMPGADGATRSLAFPFRAFPQSVWTLLADGVRWVPLFGLDDAQSMDAAGRGMRAMAGLAIQQCRPVLGQDPWLLPMLLAMEAPVGQKSVEKMAKALLKTERTDLPLWSAYAQVLMRAGKWDEARRVYLTAIASSRAFPKDARAGSAQLYTLLADLEITQGQPKAAVNVLISAADDAALSEDYMSTEPQPTRLLKTRKHFAQRVSQILRVTDPNTYSPDMAELLDAAYASAMLEHLTQGVDAGNAQFEMLVGQCQAHAVEVQQLMGDDGGADGAGGGGTQPASLLEEYVLEMWARHLFLRSTSGEAFKPAALRDVLERAIQRFPGNTLFLVLYGWNEARVGFENRVRRFLGEQFDRTRRPATLLFSVWSEMHQRTGTNTNAVRALLQKALDDAGMRHSPVVWLLAIELEMRTGGTERAKALFFQAIRACPWSKELYLLPFGPLAELFSDKELEEVYALMEDKEIRVRFPLE
nr:hypothetical protein HK105_007979 [Polyrhizophydium stewartii]